jgi:L-amino acid N-acyltransferase YncA
MSNDRPRHDVEIRAITAADVDGLRAFFEGIPDGDRTFFREDVLAEGAIERWLDDPRQHRLLALHNGAIAAHLAVIAGVGWSRHVGEIRLVVGPDHRGVGLGRLLAQRAVAEAVGLGLTKLVVEVAAEQEATVAMFSKLGFEPEALFKEHVVDQSGAPHDLLVLAHFVDELWSTMTTTGIDDVVMGADA